MQSTLQNVFTKFDSEVSQNEVMSFEKYLEIVYDQPWITRNMFQILYDMIIAGGVEHTIVAGKPPIHKYNFFEDENSVTNFVVFGQQQAKENLVERIYNASRGNEASKRLWILLGPPGSAKSRSMEAIKTSLNLLNAMNKYDCNNIIFSSSATVYG